MSFNDPVDSRGTRSTKWDRMEQLYGVSPENGIAMWTAVADYVSAPCIRDAVRNAADHGVFGYSWEYPEYLAAIAWWMKTRHGWEVDTDWIFTTQGVGNAIALCLDVWTEPGDAVAIFPPVYHEFAHKVKKAGRVVTECPLVRDGDVYSLDLNDAQARLTGRETMLIWCSPQNPSGRVWSADELRAVSEFARRNGMLLISDEIHHDLVYPGRSFVPMDIAAPNGRPWTVYTTAASKTFNIPGLRTGNMIIPDEALRTAMRKRLASLDYYPNALGMRMVEAAYSPEGADWADAQMKHLGQMRRLFDEGVNAIPGVWSMPLQSTFLAWVDFSGTGMESSEISGRIRKAGIAAADGPTFGTGGEACMRFTIATQRPVLEEAISRLQGAFADLQ